MNESKTRPNDANTAAPDNAWAIAEFITTLLDQTDRTDDVAQAIRQTWGGEILYIRKSSDAKYDLIQEEIRKSTREFYREQCRKYGISPRQFHRALHGRPRQAELPDEDQLTLPDVI